MNTFSMAVKNLKKNLSFYSLYLVSAAFVITVFFAFTSFSVNTVMLEKISTDGRVETMCHTISLFLMVFVVFYMAYSNRFFLRRRTKELGIYALLGYRKADILSLLTFENLLICFGAYILGMAAGGFAHKGIVCFINHLLHLGIDTSRIPFWNFSAVSRTTLFVSAVVLVLSLSNARFLYKTTLMNLVRFEKSAEKKMRLRRFPALLGFLMIAGGYILALDILRGNRSLWIRAGFYQTGLLTMFLVVCGTALFIASFLPYMMERSKKQKRRFYTGTSIITTPNFIYRIRSNARTLIMLTLLSAAVLTISSVMALTLYYPAAAISRIAPSEIEFRIEKDDQIKAIEQILKKYVPDTQDITLTRTDIYNVTSDSENLPAEYYLGSAQNGADQKTLLREAGFECMSYSQYAELLEAQGKQSVPDQPGALSDDECILIKYLPDEDNQSEKGDPYALRTGNREKTVTVKAVSLDNAISFANSIGTLVISDSLYSEISQNQTPSVSIVSLNGRPLEDNETLYQALSDYLDGSPYLQGNSHRVNELMHLNSSTFLLIGFLVILFFIAVGSILYFNNLSAVIDSRADYEILGKMGYRTSQIRRIIRKQTLTFFGIPFILGLLDCIFATIVYKIGLMQNILGNSPSQYVPVIIAVLLTALIYGIYYFLTVRSCYKAAKICYNT